MMPTEGMCPVNHAERVRMGMAFCYHCDAPLQSLEAAAQIREVRELPLQQRLEILESRVSRLEEIPVSQGQAI